MHAQGSSQFLLSPTLGLKEHDNYEHAASPRRLRTPVNYS
jgi:hypothetical protein